MSAIEITDAEAVHPGYGFLSENANFARILEENNIKFIGASSKLIENCLGWIQPRYPALAARWPGFNPSRFCTASTSIRLPRSHFTASTWPQSDRQQAVSTKAGANSFIGRASSNLKLLVYHIPTLRAIGVWVFFISYMLFRWNSEMRYVLHLFDYSWICWSSVKSFEPWLARVMLQQLLDTTDQVRRSWNLQKSRNLWYMIKAPYKSKVLA